MKNICIGLGLFFCTIGFSQNYTIVMHGGAGNGLQPKNYSAERKAAIDSAVKAALQAGAEVLDNGGKATDAVVAVISLLENSPLFNAGKGAVLTWDGQASLDASIMDGGTLNAGAVAGVTSVKNPIEAARAVMLYSPHVLLSGSGADAFALTNQLTTVSPDYFITESSKKSLARYKEKYGSQSDFDSIYKFGTVGCAVLDGEGNLAAGTSTGGMTGKRHGRIGDSPIIGAGTYASNETCALSCTGHGEYFIRYAVAYQINALMKYKGMGGAEAAHEVIQQVLKPAGGDGGVIGVTAEGEIIMEFNTKGMIRGFLKQGQPATVRLFKD